ncbi:MAG: hypothetical protein V3S16_09670 [Candidatus Desulfatibia sp.]|uniref:hypothetical protein n=1 Tax=Candidatus Desulfatibia sp. TaxID=3101189 RepID=UPI002F2BDC55
MIDFEMGKMRTILILMVLILAGCIQDLPAIQGPQTTHRIFNEHGRYEGRVDTRGRIFNEHGKYKGRVTK